VTWLSLLKLALSLAAKLAGIVKDRNLMAAGEARGLAKALETQNARIDKALAARRGAVDRPDAGDPGADDGFRRD
jgi:hypothetical protein